MNTQLKRIVSTLGFFSSVLAIAEGPAKTAPLSTAYYKQISPNTYVLSLSPGTKLIESLKLFQKRTKALTASITGLGALKNIHLAQYRAVGEPLVNGGVATSPSLDETFIKGHREIVSLTCNLTTKVLTGESASPSEPHCHVAVAGSDDASLSPEGGYRVVGGHLVEAEVAVIGEIFVTTYPRPVNKKSGGSLGGHVLDLDEKNGAIALN